MGELPCEHIHDPLTRGHIDGVERLVHEYPFWCMQHQTGESDRLLLVLVELVIPTARLVQQWHQAAEPQPMQRFLIGLPLESSDRRGVGQRLLQRAWR